MISNVFKTHIPIPPITAPEIIPNTPIKLPSFKNIALISLGLAPRESIRATSFRLLIIIIRSELIIFNAATIIINIKTKNKALFSILRAAKKFPFCSHHPITPTPTGTAFLIFSISLNG